MATRNPKELVRYILVRSNSSLDCFEELLSAALGTTDSSPYIRECNFEEFELVENYVSRFEYETHAIEILQVDNNSQFTRSLEQRIADHIRKEIPGKRERAAKAALAKEKQQKAALLRKEEAEAKAISDAKNLLKKKGLL